MKQWTNEKVGRAKKTEMDEELKQLIQETDLQREYFERLQKALSDYIHIYDKRVDTQEEKKVQPVNAMGLLTINFGTIYPANSALGQALLKYGEGHTKLSEVQTDFVNRSRKGFEFYLNSIGSEMKSYSSLKKKFDHRRLDLDDIQARVKKSSKEKPQLVQELRVSQDKYEESLDELTKKIFDLNNCNNRHLDSLREFCLTELEYHRNAVDILTDVYNNISNLREEEISYEDYATSLNTSPTTYDKGVAYARNSTTHSSRKSSYSSYGNLSHSNSSTNSPMHESPSLGATSYNSTLNNVAHAAPPPLPRQNGLRQVRANFDFTAEAPNELTMKVGDIINVIKEIDEGWWQGEMADGSGRSGIFPQNYTTEITPVQTKNSVSSNATSNTYNNSVSEVTQSLANNSIGYRKPSVSNGSIGSTSRKTSVTAELQQKIGSNSYRSNSFVPKQEVSNNNASDNNVGACSTCGCNDYALNVFKPPLCNNCFHQH